LCAIVGVRIDIVEELLTLVTFDVAFIILLVVGFVAANVLEQLSLVRFILGESEG